MKLTREQRKNLELYKSYRDSPPSIWQLLRLNLWRYLLIALLVAVLYIIAPAAGLASLPLIATGLLLGILVRDIGIYLRFIRIWPATAAVLDWSRLEALLAETPEKK